MQYLQYLQYRPEIKFLLINHSDEKVKILYNSNPHPFQLPKIGNRPPFYTNPRYEQYYPVI
ncbi:hypothetical protein [Neobacillus muris]|uniref:hypothetical protein n=1 Tax=Neobacillus muris TaxID=2941334 RepID=UPI00203DFB7F|nr:hypothetical protein [Neobacillus muris]